MPKKEVKQTKQTKRKNKTMSCPDFLSWTIQKHHLNEISGILLANNEQSGAILFETPHDFHSSKIIVSSTGDKQSVNIRLAKNHVLSFHSHPFEAYINSGCVYGHPSADDLVEFIKLGIKGVLTNAVLTLEGIYITQVHPRFIKFIKSLTRTQCTKLYKQIFDYFKYFHHKRTLEYTKKHAYNPRQFVDKVNSFKLSKVASEHMYKYPKLFGMTFYYADNFKQYEHDLTSRWQLTVNKQLPVVYTNSKDITFQFIKLDEVEDRTLSTIVDTLTNCVSKSIS
uniref:Uncharacterized protein n=1 Tax=viral metagenome TaxID=1070528 RepID=A0A6C0CTS5_9ZZZZ